MFCVSFLKSYRMRGVEPIHQLEVNGYAFGFWFCFLWSDAVNRWILHSYVHFFLRAGKVKIEVGGSDDHTIRPASLGRLYYFSIPRRLFPELYSVESPCIFILLVYHEEDIVSPNLPAFVETHMHADVLKCIPGQVNTGKCFTIPAVPNMAICEECYSCRNRPRLQ